MTLVKDTSFQRGCSLAIITCIVLYQILTTNMEWKAVAATYEATTYVGNAAFFIAIVGRMFFWVFVWLALLSICLGIIQTLVIGVMRFQSQDVLAMASEAPNALLHVSERLDKQKGQMATPRDILHLVYGLFAYKRGQMFAIWIAVECILLAIAFSAVIAPPDRMATAQSREANVRLFMIALSSLFTVMVVAFAALPGV